MSYFCTVSVTFSNISWNYSSALSDCNALSVALTSWSMPLVVTDVHCKERFSCSSRPNTSTAMRNTSNVVLPFWKKSSNPAALVDVSTFVVLLMFSKEIRTTSYWSTTAFNEHTRQSHLVGHDVLSLRAVSTLMQCQTSACIYRNVHTILQGS